MHIDKFKYPISIQEAIEKIKLNSGHSFIWFPVINKKGYKFELGGKKEQIIASIPEYKNKNIVTNPLNDYSKHHFSIGYNAFLHPYDGINTSKEKLLKLIELDLDEFVKKQEYVPVTEYELQTEFIYKK